MIGIIAAMEEEVNELLVLMKDVQEKEISYHHFWLGKLNKKEVILVLSGVGKGNAAMTTTILLEHFSLTHLINIGVAGGLLPNQNILDIVVSDTIVQHDFDSSGLDGEAGLGLSFESDQNLREICTQVLKQLQKPYHVGMIASGDQFICEDNQRQRLKTVFPEAICAEMEAGAIVQVCNCYHIPCIILRSLSDITCQEDSPMDFLEYVKQASKASALVCQKVIAHI